MYRLGFIKKLLHEESGVTIIQFALIIPALVMVSMAVLEYGLYYVQNQQNLHNVAITAQAVKYGAQDQTNGELLSQSEFINAENNKICAKSFVTEEKAEKGKCKGTWDTLPPKNLPAGQNNYFVLIESDAYSGAITPLFEDLIPDNIVRQVVEVNATTVSQTCNGVALSGRVCMSATESFSYTYNQSDSADDGSGCDDEFTATGSSSRTNTTVIGDAECSSSGWSCDHLASTALSTSNPYGNSSNVCSYASSATKVVVGLYQESGYSNCNGSNTTSISGSPQPAIDAAKKCYSSGNPPYSP